MSKFATAARADTGFAAAAPDSNVRQFLATALTYLLTPRELLSLWRMDDMTIRAIGVTREELGLTLAGVRPNSEK